MQLRAYGFGMTTKAGLPTMAELVVASNRGPVQFEVDDDGNLSSGRGAGGMVAALGPALAGQAGTWVAAAISDGDRVAARRVARSGRLRTVELAQGSVRLRSLVTDPREYQNYYNRVSNRTIWFLHHHLFDVARHPRFDRSFRIAWQHYQAINQAFAAACDDEADRGGEVFVQDYHLALAPAMLRARRPDLGIAHFTHCPWADPGYYTMLPGRVAGALLDGMLGADLLGFLVPRWARNFLHCCLDAGHRVDFDRGSVATAEGRTVLVRTYPLGVDGDALRERATKPDTQAQARVVAELARGRSLIVRVDRMELSKNILRGLEGYGTFLERNPKARGRVVHYALAYASRRDLPEYQAYTAEVKHAAEAINERFRTRTWEPVVLELKDNYPRALAAMSLADVLIVNPVWDGMNLVAKEGPAVSRRDMALILSRNAGAADDLGEAALLVNPFDTAELAETIAAAVAMPPDERAKRAARLRDGAEALPPQDWFLVQRDDLSRIRSGG
jgi:trehalose 6-phosphate synthase